MVHMSLVKPVLPDSTIQCRTVCPKCGNESLIEIRAIAVEEAFMTGAELRLFSACHNQTWVANSLERDQLRDHLAATRLALPEPAVLPPSMFIPITCRSCGRESLVEYPIAVVAVALTRWNNMRLYACCTLDSWDASPSELERIREHVGTEWLDENNVGRNSGMRVNQTRDSLS